MENGLASPEIFEPAFVPEVIEASDMEAPEENPLTWDDLSIEENSLDENVTLFEAHPTIKESLLYNQQEKIEDGRIDWEEEDMEKSSKITNIVEGKVPLTYEPEFDRKRWRELEDDKNTNPELYAKDEEVLRNHIKWQINTFIGERLNARQYEYTQLIENGHVVAQNGNEKVTMTELAERGVKYRENMGTPMSQRREQKELEGYKKIDGFLANPNTPIGSMTLSVSPPGEGYQKNFVDIHRKELSIDGIPYVQSTRYSSDLSIGEYLELRFNLKYGMNAPDVPSEQLPTASYFLADPLMITDIEQFPTKDSLLEYIYTDHNNVSVEDFERVKHTIDPYIERYNDILADNPDDYNSVDLLNAIMNIADYAIETIEEGTYEEEFIFNIPDVDIDYWADQEVREVISECGWSGAIESLEQSSPNAPFSVVEFGFDKDHYGSLTFKCPTCLYENRRPYGKMIDLCQNENCSNREGVSCHRKILRGETEAVFTEKKFAIKKTKERKIKRKKKSFIESLIEASSKVEKKDKVNIKSKNQTRQSLKNTEKVVDFTKVLKEKDLEKQKIQKATKLIKAA